MSNNYVFVHVSTIIRSSSSSFSDFLVPAVEEPGFPELDSEESGFLELESGFSESESEFLRSVSEESGSSGGGFRFNLILNLHAETGGLYSSSSSFRSVNGFVPALN